MVHVGVSGIAKELTLEQLAHNDGYDKYDIRNSCPAGHCCVDGATSSIKSRIDMVRVRDAVNNAHCGVEAIVSLDPGR